MNIRVIARHCTVPETVILHAQRRVEELRRFDPRLLAADIAFEHDGRLYRVDVLLKVARMPDVFARGDAEDLGTAFHRAVQRLRRQLVRGRQKMRARRAAPAHAAPAGN